MAETKIIGKIKLHSRLGYLPAEAEFQLVQHGNGHIDMVSLDSGEIMGEGVAPLPPALEEEIERAKAVGKLFDEVLSHFEFRTLKEPTGGKEGR
jgi:hypothetical protein